MMKVISNSDREKWNKAIKSFENWDIYYLCEYAISFMKHGDGEPYLLYFEHDKCSMCYVAIISDISNFQAFNNKLPPKKYFDMATPYGYGGPLVKGEFNIEIEELFMSELKVFCKNNNIVTQFFRFHPLYQNQVYSENVSEVVLAKETIAIETSSKEIILKNMDSKNRNMVRKAKKFGVTIIRDNGGKIEEFIRIYESTMDKHEARDYYYFERQYYDYLITEMQDNTIIFYSCYKDDIIGASIFLYNNNYMHYHLSGNLQEFRHLAATNLLLYEAALWACQRGINYLHLGGGIGNENGLFRFKKKFNKNGHLPFYIGRNIFDITTYNELLRIRKEIDHEFDVNNPYFIQYRR